MVGLGRNLRVYSNNAEYIYFLHLGLKKMYQYTIQRADLSVQDFEASTVEQLVKAFNDFDWATELKVEEELLEKGSKDCCPPGLIVTLENGSMLHVGPASLENLYFYYLGKEKKKFLFVFDTESEVSLSNINYPKENLDELFQKFIDGDQSWLMTQSGE